jgi:hypothetical protein
MGKHPEAILTKIEGILENARDARRQLEAEAFGFSLNHGYEAPQAALESHLEQAETLLEMFLEGAQLPLTRERLIREWVLFQKAGIGKTKAYPEVDYLESKPLTYLETMLEGSRVILGQVPSERESYELVKLESLLRKTATLLHRRRIVPSNEHDIQSCMHDYLDAFFPEYTNKVHISGGVTTFKPDAGIRNLKAAIEFKFAATREEVSRSLRGIFEDVTGYAGSADWIRFYSVIYQTEAFESEEKFRADLRRAGAASWTPVLVTGGGARHKAKQLAAARLKRQAPSRRNSLQT